MRSHPRYSKTPALRRRQRSEGFTLVEIMIAVVLAGMVLASAFSSMAFGFNMVDKSRDYTRIAQILQSEMEDLRTRNWSYLELLDTNTWVEVAAGTEFSDAFGAKYTVERHVTSVGRPTDQKEVTIRVTWLDSGGTQQSKLIKTWFTKGGLNDYFYRTF